MLLLALHFLLGARVRRVERSNDAAGVAGPMRGIQLGVLLLAALIVSCVLVWKRATVAPSPPRRTTVVTVPLGLP